MSSSLLPFNEQNSPSSHLQAILYLGKQGKVQEMGLPMVREEMHKEIIHIQFLTPRQNFYVCSQTMGLTISFYSVEQMPLLIKIDPICAEFMVKRKRSSKVQSLIVNLYLPHLLLYGSHFLLLLYVMWKALSNSRRPVLEYVVECMSAVGKCRNFSSFAQGVGPLFILFIPLQ